MFEVDATTMTFSLAVALGLIFGLGPCNISCLPYLGPVFFARDGGVRNSWRTIVPFSFGRLTGYAVLGLLSGLLGEMIQAGLEGSWVRMVLGGATVTVGLGLLYLTTQKQRQGCSAGATPGLFERFGSRFRLQNLLPGGLFFMGVGMALNPCAPLGTVMLAASATASTTVGLSLGLGFGLGAILMPAIIFGVGVAYFGEQIRVQLREWRVGLERTSAVLLVLMGGSVYLF